MVSRQRAGKSPPPLLKEEDEENATTAKCRYHIDYRPGEAVDMIKAAILSRPAARQTSLDYSQESQRYQIDTYGAPQGQDYAPLSTRLSELLVTPGPAGGGQTPPGAVVRASPSLEHWSPASAMRIARQKQRDTDIVPSSAAATARPKKGKPRRKS